MNSQAKSSLYVTGLLLGALVVSALSIAMPIEGTVATPGGFVVQGWLNGSVRRLYPLAIALAGGLSYALWRLTGALLGPVPAGTRSPKAVLQALRPLVWLPAVFLGRHSAALAGTTAAGFFLPYGGTLVAAICLERLVGPRLSDRTGDPAGVDRVRMGRFRLPDGLALFIAYFLFSLAVWHSPLTDRFNGGGDVVHYRTQIENLLENGNIDLTSRMDKMMDEDRVPDTKGARRAYLRRSHMVVNADGRVFSYHSFGFPLLVWPFLVVFGKAGVPLFLSLLSAAGLAGCRAACRAAGVSRTSANTVAALMGLSFVWVFTGMSYLPEMTGCALCAWAFWAVLAQNDPGKRLPATVVSFIACAYLPYAHVRFAPMALTLSGLFCLEGLFLGDEPFWRRKAPRLGTLAFSCACAWGLLMVLHMKMYSGSSAYDYSGTLFSCPLAMWGMFADPRGLVVLLPVLWVLAAAPLRCLFARDRAARWGLWGLLVLAAVLLSCCTNRASLGGACLNGRYLFTCVPALLPALALALGRTDRAGRIWIFLLFLLPVLYFLFVLPFVWRGSTIRTPAPMWSLLPFQGLWRPLVSVLGTGGADARRASAVFTISMSLLSFLSCFKMKTRFKIPAAAILLALGFSCGRIADAKVFHDRREAVATLFSGRRWSDFRILNGKEKTSFFHAMGCYKPGEYESKRTVMKLTDDPEAVRGENDGILRRVGKIRTMEFGGVKSRWVPLTSSSIESRGKGTIALWLKGRVTRGSARLLLLRDADSAIPGGIRLGTGPFEFVFLVDTGRSTGGVNVFASLEKDVGEMIVEKFVMAPYMKGMESACGAFPQGARIVRTPAE